MVPLVSWTIAMKAFGMIVKPLLGYLDRKHRQQLLTTARIIMMVKGLADDTPRQTPIPARQRQEHQVNVAVASADWLVQVAF